MKLHLVREWNTDNSTIGELFIDGQRECFTLEDPVRAGPKISGRTAIPEGTYKIIVSMSPRFRRELPLLMNVPGFSGVRIHSGNTSGDTEGCILVGEIRGDDSIGRSRLAFDLLFAKIQTAKKAGIPVEINISNESREA